MTNENLVCLVEFRFELLERIDRAVVLFTTFTSRNFHILFLSRFYGIPT